MSQTDPRTLTYAELDRLSGDVLPGRFLLSATGQGPDTQATQACQYSHSDGTTGLLGTGLLAEPGYSTTTCIPVVVHHDS